MFGDVLIYSILLAFLFEFLTTVLRLVFHLKSAPIQKKLHMPRIHHAYFGIVFLLAFLVLREELIAIVGIALVLSDIVHHSLTVPLLRLFRIDIQWCTTKRHTRYSNYSQERFLCSLELLPIFKFYSAALIFSAMFSISPSL